MSGTARVALAACAAGALLHLYTAVFKAEGGPSLFLAGLVLLSLAPYAVAALLARRPRGGPLALGFALASLLADGYMHYAVFVAPKSSTAALGLLFMPIWNLLVVGPAGAALAWLGHRLLVRSHRTGGAS